MHVVYDAVNVEESILPSLAFNKIGMDVKVLNEKLFHISKDSLVHNVLAHLLVLGHLLPLVGLVDREELVLHALDLRVGPL